MHARSAVVLLVTIALLYACGSRTHAFSMATAAAATGESAEMPIVTSTTPTTPALVAKAHAPGALTSALHVDVHDDDITFTLAVTNVSSNKIELTFPNGQTHDVAVLDAAGGEVWRWGAGQMFTQALRNKTLDSRATLSYAVRWRRPQIHGPLTAVGTLTSVNFPVESRAPFVLP